MSIKQDGNDETTSKPVLLGADGVPASADASGARKADEATAPASEPAPGPVPAPVPLEPVTVALEGGPVQIRTKIEFDERLKVGGGQRAAFQGTINAILARTNAVALRLIEMLFVAGETKSDVGAPLHGCVGDLDVMRRALEEIIKQMRSGQEVGVPTVEVATANDVPAAPARKARRNRK